MAGRVRECPSRSERIRRSCAAGTTGHTNPRHEDSSQLEGLPETATYIRFNGAGLKFSRPIPDKLLFSQRRQMNPLKQLPLFAISLFAVVPAFAQKTTSISLANISGVTAAATAG